MYYLTEAKPPRRGGGAKRYLGVVAVTFSREAKKRPVLAPSWQRGMGPDMMGEMMEVVAGADQ